MVLVGGLCLRAQITATDIIYECNPRMFGANNSLSAVESQLDRIQQQGTTVLWLMPVYARGNDYRSCGSPYCVSDYRSIYAPYGTMSNMQSLVNACHQRGMRIIIDWVANHTAWDHAWVSQHSDWYTTAQTSSEQGWNDVTFLNYNNANMRNAMIGEMKYWVQSIGVDGFRCDYAEGVPNNFWSTAISQLRAIRPNLIMLAEAGDVSLYNVGFDMLYSWDYLYDVEKCWAHQRSFTDLFQTSGNEFNTTPAGKHRMRYITTHDASSEHALSEFFPTADAALGAHVLTIFEGGVPMYYSSVEVGYMSAISILGNSTPVMNFNGQTTLQNRYAEVHRIWKETATLRSGTKSHPATSTSEVACIRYDSPGNQPLIVVVNRSAQTQTFTVSGLSGSKNLPAYGYEIIYESAPAVEHYIYVNNETGWNPLYMYAWTTSGAEEGDAFTGPWPGMTATGTVVKDGVTWLVFPMPESGSYMLIFNNNNGSQLQDVPVNGGQTYYINASPTGASVVTTDIVNTLADEATRIRKYIKNGHLYIQRGATVLWVQ